MCEITGYNKRTGFLSARQIIDFKVMIDTFDLVLRMMIDVDDGGFRAGADFFNQGKFKIDV